MRKIASLVALAFIFSSVSVHATKVEEVVAEAEPSTVSEELPPLPKVDTDQLYAREKSTKLELNGQLVTTLTYKTPTQAFSEQHQ